KTRELLPEPETPVNTVSRRLGISMLMFFRLFSRAPCTRITSWLSATCTGDVPLVAMLVSLPSAGSSGRRGPHRPVHSGGITRDDLRNYAPGGAGRGRIPASPDPAARRP